MLGCQCAPQGIDSQSPSQEERHAVTVRMTLGDPALSLVFAAMRSQQRGARLSG